MLRERNNQLLLKKKNSNQLFCDGGLTCLKNRRNSAFWLALVILLVTVFVSVVAYVRWYTLGFFVGSLFFVHWLSLAATTFIVLLVPIYYVLKRRSPQRIRILLKIHVFGNLFAFLLVSIHFAQNTGRLSGFYLRLGEGFVLFSVLCLIVATGMLERFGGKNKIVRYTRPIHRYAVAVLYLVMILHVIQALNII